jgi:glutaminyl-peptide cyclotransferase
MQRILAGILIVAAVALAFGSFRGVHSSSPSIVGQPVVQEQEQKRPREAFAADRDNVGFPIDQERTMKYLNEICKIGPRISGTEGMKKQQELLKKHFESLGGKVEMQKFMGKQINKPPVEMENMIVSWRPEAERRIILCSHYDTRPMAHEEKNERDWTRPFISANDGGSGVALLMELANHMKDFKSNVGVDFVLFDGEEYVFRPRGDTYFFGSDHFANNYRDTPPGYKYIGAALLDMIGGKNAQFPAEQNSWRSTEPMVRQIWTIANELNCDAFKDRVGPDVLDDHLALNRVGIPAVDIIDFDYAHWHKLSDIPENCSAAPMAQVARVLGVWIQRQK